jgi:putative transposase
VRQDSHIINKSVFLALGINIEGQKELPGMWLAENEGAKFWLNVLTELKNRGLSDIFIACVDGLKGFPDAINAVYPDTKMQLCIVHMVRNSLRFVAWKDYKAVTRESEADIPCCHGRISACGAGCVQRDMGSALSTDKP